MAFWLSGQSQPLFWLGFWPALDFHQAKANGFQAKAVASRPSQSQTITTSHFVPKPCFCTVLPRFSAHESSIIPRFLGVVRLPGLSLL
ncbi:hypothetical protein C8R43DRAFT_1040174 [Mycena crocata]|nr:hypothetical protein C8R43DRAFT_1040174 [Mycena crocata]